MHLILPLAASPDWRQHLPDARTLPQLRQLLTRLQPVAHLSDADDARPHPLLAHERLWAQAQGWPDAGPWPQAAQRTGQAGAQAWITPCHWQIGMDQVVMLPPALLQLQNEESQQLMQAMQPWLAEDGLQLRWHDALHWHAQGPLLAQVRSASLARVSGANIRPWLTDGSLPGPLRRLQSEMQMLLYQHPVNDARLARGQLPVNSFWLHGAGEPRAGTQHSAVLHSELLDAAQQGPEAWRAAWPALDAGVLAPLVQRLHSAPQTDALQLSLCSQGSAITWANAPRPWPQRLRQNLRQWLRPVDPVRAALDLLIQEATP